MSGSLSNLALLYRDQGEYARARPLIERSLAIAERTLGVDHSHVATILNNLALLYRDQRQHAQAEPLFKRSLAIDEKVFGPNHPNVSKGLNNLASLYVYQGRYELAEPLYKRSLAIVEHALGFDHPALAVTLGSFAELYDQQARKDEALNYSRRNFQLLRRRFSTDGGNAGAVQSERKLNRHAFAIHILRLSGKPASASTTESFDAFQLAQTSNTGQSVAQMAVRFSAQGGELAKAIRELQDSQEKLSRADRAFIEALGQPPAKFDVARITALREDLARMEKSLVEQSRAIASRFPDYDALVSPAPLAVSEVQKLLRSDEAMVTYLIDDSVGSFAWVVRVDRIDFRRLDITAEEISAYIKRLRAKLDPAQNSRLLPFDAKAANALYLKIFAPLESALEEARHVILVPDGALQSLPLAVLVDRAETDAAPASWLADRYAFSTMPSVSALRALRAFTRVPLAEAPFVGFGDPVLGGGATAQRQLAARSLFVADGASTIGPTRIGIADVRAIRQAESLPETADELRALSAALGASATSLYLQDKATETNAKNLDLYRYRVIAFATHGLMAGEMTGVVEPGLILTPPAEGSLLDDGYLTASEVIQLKLNADWVLLSACNTAAPDGTPGAEGLSGLAKAFFYAGARSLLVSNWYVASDAAVRITTEMLKSYSADPKLGKAEALRSSMKKLRADPKFAHPLYWAPFTVVGEGGVTAEMVKK